MTTRKRHIKMVALLTIGGLIATACGDDDDDASSDDDPVTTEATADNTEAPDGTATEVTAPGTTEAQAGDGETYTIRLPHHMAEPTIDHQCITDFADAVTERSGGRIEFDITPAGALGGEADVEQNVFEGVFEMSYMSNVFMGVWHEPANLVSLPWLLLSTDDAKTLYESEIFLDMKEDFKEAKGARILDYCAIAERAIATNNEVQVPDDMSGLKIRVPELPVFIEAYRTLGAEPTPLPFPEVYQAMSSGIVDGVDADFSTFATLGFTEVADYFTRIGHQLTAQYLIINEEFFQSLPQDLQDIIVDTSTEVVAGQAEERTQALSDEFTQALIDQGGNVEANLDKTPFQEATAPTRQALAEQYGIEDQLQATLELLGYD